MANKLNESLVEPIVNASRPGTLAALSLTILNLGKDNNVIPGLPIFLATSAIMFLLSSFFIFFYTLYPTKRTLWVVTSISFVLGLICLAISSTVLLATFIF